MLRGDAEGKATEREGKNGRKSLLNVSRGVKSVILED